MLTPQEVSDRGFTKTSFGGYNLIQVDEFLEILTKDYTTLYSENTTLKRKMKVMQDKIDEYRDTEENMRKAFSAAQQIGDHMVAEANNKSKILMEEARAEIEVMRKNVMDECYAEEQRLASLKQVTAQYVEQVRELHRKEMEYLDTLGGIGTMGGGRIPDPQPVAPVRPMAPQEPVQQPAPPPQAPQNNMSNDVQMFLQKAMVDVLGEKKAAELTEENYGSLQQIYRTAPPPVEEPMVDSSEATTRFLLRGDLESASKPAHQIAEDHEYDAELARTGSRIDFNRLQQEFGHGNNNNGNQQ